MKLEQIKNIKSLLQLAPSTKVLKYKIQPLTAPGENYGSVMLRVDISIESALGSDDIHVVVKTVPPSQFLQELFNIQVSFRNEVAFYKKIVPLLQNFQKECGVDKIIDFFPKYYGSRLNLKDDDGKVDLDGALVLENLKLDNYVTLERTQGLDLETAKLVLTDLAHLHAVPLAFKLQKPEVFENDIKPYLYTWLPLEEGHNTMKKQLCLIIDEIKAVVPFKDRILAGFEMEMVPHAPKEPFATITHNDCWTNNNMIKMERDKPVKNKLVDYQVCDYASPARDIVFFLFSSVRSDVVAKHYDNLLKLYYETFLSVLESLNCDVSLFSFEALEREIDFEARNSEFAHVMFMLFPMFAVKEEVKEISEVTPESLVGSKITDLFKERLVFVVKEFVKRNWI